MPSNAAVKKTVAKKPVKVAVLKPMAHHEPTLPPVEIEHISPQEAVEHIQALLDAKHERVRQGPTWPGAVTTQPAPNAPDPHAPASTGGISSEAAFGHALAHERGDQSKRKD
jgi:hypothetical protein